MIHGTEPAMPFVELTQSDDAVVEKWLYLENNVKKGLTIRQHFAALALSSGRSAKDSLIEADELIKLLNDE